MKLLRIVVVLAALLMTVACSPKVPKPKLETTHAEVAKEGPTHADMKQQRMN